MKDLAKIAGKNLLLTKILLTMKLTLTIILICVAGVSASTYSQNTRLDVSMKNGTMVDLIQQIEANSEFFFYYQKEELKELDKIHLEAQNATIMDILDKALEGTPFNYSILDRYIVVRQNNDNFGKELLASALNAAVLQQRSVSGTVTDNQGNPLPGVTVIITGTTRGTATNMDGQYSISNVNPDDILVFSSVGMVSRRIDINEQTQINVVLEDDFIGLEEVIAIGYGTVRRSDLTGSVMRISGEEFRTQQMIQITDMFAGTVAGFYAQQATSAAGGSSMEIRGPNSLSAATDPLIVLDGAIYNGSLRDINPNDIESIDILKDASSSAIFGAKAASGVVIITTTKGRIGDPAINFSTKIGMAEAASHYRPLGPQEYLQFRGDYLRTRSAFEIPEYFFTNPDNLPDIISIEEWRNYRNNPHTDNVMEYLQRHSLEGIEIDQYLKAESANWYDMVMVQGLRQDYDLSINGGTENLNYYWSLGYTDNEGIIKGDQFSAVRSRVNLEFSATDWLNTGINAQYSNRDESATPASLTRTYRVSPWGAPYNEDGTLRILPYGLFSAEHPLMEYYGTDRDRKVNSLFANIYAQVDFPLGFNYKISFQPRFGGTKDFQFYGDQHIMGYATHIGGYGSRSESSVYEWMIDNIVKWNRVVGVHSFDLTLLHSAEQFQSWSTDINNETFSPNLQLGYHGLQFGINPQISNDDVISTGDALMARLNYTLLGRYFLTASVRRDGYSAFGQENPRATFPALAFAWQISEESFFDVELIPRMKFRVSWGINGNRDIGRYSALANIAARPYYDGARIHIGTFNSTLANTGLRWEQTEAINFGVDMGLFKNRIDLSVDYYNMTTIDLLMNRILPEITGFKNIMANLGELENRGFEATLNTVNVNTSNLTWRSGLVFSLNRNKINRLFGDFGTYTLLGEEHEGELPDFSNQWFPGQAIDAVWDYEIIGIWQEDEAGDAAQYGLRMGDYKVVDVNEDGQYTQFQDKQFIGHTVPRYRLGFRNDFSFLNNFTAFIFIRADLGHIGNYTPPFQNYNEHDKFNMLGRPFPYWIPENPNNEYPRLDARATRGSYEGNLNVYKSLSFVRIQDLSLSYALPPPVANRLLMNSMSIFFSIRNLYSFDNWPDFDPESLVSPMPRTFTVGLDLSL
jgi:TonB-dependent starch-binding outer membrane protein SusC